MIHQGTVSGVATFRNEKCLVYLSVSLKESKPYRVSNTRTTNETSVIGQGSRLALCHCSSMMCLVTLSAISNEKMRQFCLRAVKTGCINAHSPDKYGHYREAKYTQTKHHWFWKLNHVFDFLDVTKNFHGPVLLIEEDHYMVEDFVPVLRLMYRLKEQTCKDCSIFTLGTYDKRPQYYASSSKGLFERLFGNNQETPPLLDKVDVMNWISSKHNMGMSLNRQVWEQIKKCSKPFCEFDDYNWDWSLQHVSMQCMPSKIRCMVMKSPRIFHIGECGVHHKGKNCDPGTKVRQIQNLLTLNHDKLFPDGLTVAGNPRTPNRMPKPNGGWGDFRDRQLCASFATPEGHR
ncbi:hypothetical protein LSH36_788g03020 [Paralvinella palmiformis]|uniref:Alpha-1,6-mannosyl-glycoprotein 2-beta-N-acetylglucosaminyltransferase n=1 Tax=Paralvinella palmiformis TaxID=53620 RepID=A0AAD9MV35_9ANNE|nr:hypothetical protein LSH36_788g03020 [Paralvinella palmiformis]